MVHGPKEIGKNRQIALPAELLAHVRLGVGDAVYIALADDPPGALLVLPVEMVSAWLDVGRRSSARDADSGAVSSDAPLAADG